MRNNLCASYLPEELVETSSSNWSGDSRICISNQFPGDSHVRGLCPEKTWHKMLAHHRAAGQAAEPLGERLGWRLAVRGAGGHLCALGGQHLCLPGHNTP